MLLQMIEKSSGNGGALTSRLFCSSDGLLTCFKQKSNGPSNGSSSPNPTGTPTKIPTELTTELTTELSKGLPTERLTEIPTELLTNLPTENLTEIQRKAGGEGGEPHPSRWLRLTAALAPFRWPKS